MIMSDTQAKTLLTKSVSVQGVETEASSFLAANGLKKNFKKSLQAFEQLRAFYKDDTPGGDNSIFESLEITPKMRSQLKSAQDVSSFVVLLRSLPVATTARGEKLSAASMLLFSSDQPFYSSLDAHLSAEDFKTLYRSFVLPIRERATELQLENCDLVVARILKESLLTLDEIEKSIYPTHWSGNHVGLWRHSEFFEKALDDNSITPDDVKKRLVDLRDLDELRWIFQTSVYINEYERGTSNKDHRLMQFILDNFLIDETAVKEDDFPYTFGNWAEDSGVAYSETKPVKEVHNVYEYLRFLNENILEQYESVASCGDANSETWVPHPNPSQEIDDAISRAAWCTSFKHLSKEEKFKLYDKIKEDLDAAEVALRPVIKNNLESSYSFDELVETLEHAAQLRVSLKSKLAKAN